jgi:RNA polymerase sigma-70 factor (ECF subfamily)
MKNINKELDNQNISHDLNIFFKKYEYTIKNCINYFLKNNTYKLNQSDIDDIFQDIAFKIIKNNYIKKFSYKKSSIKTWISIISRTVTIDYLRKIKNYNFKYYELYIDKDVETDNIKLKTPPGVLTQRQTQILEMSFVEGLKSVEIAEKLKIKSGTVRSIKHQSINKLREYLDIHTKRRKKS